MAMFATWWIGMMNFKKSQNESESLEEERRSGGGTLEAAGLRQMTNAFWGLKGRSGETLAMFACTEQNYTGYATYIGWWIIMESGLWGDQEVWGDSDFWEEEDLGWIWTRLEDRSLKIQTSILLLCDWGTWGNMDEIGGWEKRERSCKVWWSLLIWKLTNENSVSRQERVGEIGASIIDQSFALKESLKWRRSFEVEQTREERCHRMGGIEARVEVQKSVLWGRKINHWGALRRSFDWSLGKINFDELENLI